MLPADVDSDECDECAVLEQCEDAGLVPDCRGGVWAVLDPDGGVWWPGDDAAAEIQASADPATTALRICWSDPMRGRWSA